MSQLVRIARGSLSSKLLASGRLGSGELFFDKASKTVYVGDGAESGVDGKQFILGGLNSIRYVGAVSALPAQPAYGDLYEASSAFTIANDGTGNVIEVKASDFIIYVYSDSDKESYNLGTSVKKWIKINNAGGSSAETVFDPTGTNFLSSSTDLQKALVDIDRHKLGYGGIFQSEAQCVPGFFYYVETNTTQYINTDSGEINVDPDAIAGVSNGRVYISKGNLLVCTSDTVENGSAITPIKKFQIVDLGSNANDITITSALTRRAGSDAFAEYNANDAVITNLQEILQRVFTTKADLDSSGKIYLDQLPSTIIGAMEYQGLWTTQNVPTAADKVDNGDTSSPNNDNTSLNKGDYWVYSGTTFYITSDGTPTTEGAAGAIRVNNGDWLIVQSFQAYPVSQATWNVLHNDATLKGIIADGVLHEGTPELTDDNRVIEVTSPIGGNTINIAAPKAMANEVITSEIGRIYKAKDEANNFDKSALIESGTSVTVEEKALALQRASGTNPGVAEVFTVENLITSPAVIVDGTSYNLGNAIPGYTFSVDGSGVFTYTADAFGAHTTTFSGGAIGTIINPGDAASLSSFTASTGISTVTVDGVTYEISAGLEGTPIPGFSYASNSYGSGTYTALAVGPHSVLAGTFSNVTEIATGAASTTLPGARASIVQNVAQTANITVTLPSKSGTLVVEEDLAKVSENVTENFIPVKEGDGFVNAPIQRTMSGATVTGIKVTGIVNVDNGTNNSSIIANTTANSINALPATNGTLLNENSDVDGGYFA